MVGCLNFGLSLSLFFCLSSAVVSFALNFVCVWCWFLLVLCGGFVCFNFVFVWVWLLLFLWVLSVVSFVLKFGLRLALAFVGPLVSSQWFCLS